MIGSMYTEKPRRGKERYEKFRRRKFFFICSSLLHICAIVHTQSRAPEPIVFVQYASGTKESQSFKYAIFNARVS